MNEMNEAITSFPFYAGISFGIFSRAMIFFLCNSSQKGYKHFFSSRETARDENNFDIDSRGVDLSTGRAQGLTFE